MSRYRSASDCSGDANAARISATPAAKHAIRQRRRGIPAQRQHVAHDERGDEHERLDVGGEGVRAHGTRSRSPSSKSCSAAGRSPSAAVGVDGGVHAEPLLQRHGDAVALAHDDGARREAEALGEQRRRRPRGGEPVLRRDHPQQVRARRAARRVGRAHAPEPVRAGPAPPQEQEPEPDRLDPGRRVVREPALAACASSPAQRAAYDVDALRAERDREHVAAGAARPALDDRPRRRAGARRPVAEHVAEARPRRGARESRARAARQGPRRRRGRGSRGRARARTAGCRRRGRTARRRPARASFPRASRRWRARSAAR